MIFSLNFSDTQFSFRLLRISTTAPLQQGRQPKSSISAFGNRCGKGTEHTTQHSWVSSFRFCVTEFEIKKGKKKLPSSRIGAGQSLFFSLPLCHKKKRFITLYICIRMKPVAYICWGGWRTERERDRERVRERKRDLGRVIYNGMIYKE